VICSLIIARIERVLTVVFQLLLVFLDKHKRSAPKLDGQLLRLVDHTLLPSQIVVLLQQGSLEVGGNERFVGSRVAGAIRGPQDTGTVRLESPITTRRRTYEAGGGWKRFSLTTFNHCQMQRRQCSYNRDKSFKICHLGVLPCGSVAGSKWRECWCDKSNGCGGDGHNAQSVPQ
jgi:hypothetical protein